ncbi:MAG: hypothetical protein ACXWPS_20545 [Ktedonobacteraceae bacterium]
MAITMSFRMGNGLLDQGNTPASVHVPMVYEQLPVEPVQWEYHVLHVDTREMDIPDAVQLNELGAQGWLLVGVVDQRITESGSNGGEDQKSRDFSSGGFDRERTGRNSIVHYYFVRQRSE